MNTWQQHKVLTAADA